MNKQLLLYLGFVVILFSCQSTETEKDTISEEHAALIGTWQENDSLESTTWVFDQFEVQWKGFTHFYEVTGDSLIISGLVYRILKQSEKEMKIVKLNGKPCILVRKD